MTTPVRKSDTRQPGADRQATGSSKEDATRQVSGVSKAGADECSVPPGPLPNSEVASPKKGRWNKMPLSPKDPALAALNIAKEIDALSAKLGLENEMQHQEENFRNASEGIKDRLRGDDPCKCMMIAGTGSIGKTQLVKEAVASSASQHIREMNVDWFSHYNASITQMIANFYEHRGGDNLLVWDDMDRTFDDLEKIELLKGALENEKTRQIYVDQRYNLPDIRPNPFSFEAKIIMITNDSLTTMIHLKRKLGPHIAALASRMYYHDLGVYTQAQKLANVYRFIKKGKLLEEFNLSSAEIIDVVRWLANNINNITIGLRQTKRIAYLRKNHPNDWQSRALSSHSVPDIPRWQDRKAF
jgi:hypothetical protein